jgi:uncharacterized protein
MGGLTATTRYESLDAIRGVAVMGILAMNIVAFALPFSAYVNPIAGGPVGDLDLATWFVSFVLVDSKMRGLFSMLFGASTLLVIQNAAATGRSAAGAHYSRMAWLAIFGLIHFYFIWFGDILFLYAMCGLLLFAFRNLSIRALLIWAGVFLAVGIGFIAFGWLLFSLAEAGKLSAEGAAQMRDDLVRLNADMGPDAASYAQEMSIHLGSYGSIVAEKLGERISEPIISALMFLWETMGLMLIGMALFKSRMLTGEWEAARYRKWAIIGFVIGVPPLVGLAWYQYASGFSAVSTFGASLALSAPFDIAATIGWAALIMLGIKTVASDTVRLAATGRMAFTNYLATSIVMTTIFYGYGLGLYGSVGRTALYLFCVAMWAAMLLWSKPWLDRFHYGPLEWLWRSLSRWQIQPMRKVAVVQ